MARAANAVDFWRGFALITIFIDHIPGLFYASYTLINFSIADAADLFVFLAGWSLRLMAQGRGEPTPINDVMLRLLGRALTIYAAQILITMLAIALLAISAIELDNALLLQWHNADAVFNDPVPTHIGLTLLTHQLGYFDILPLYVVLMLMAPFFALIDRMAKPLLLPLSFALYILVLAFRITLPTWPVAGTWFFNPLAWQFIFVLGFALADGAHGPGAFVRKHIKALRLILLPIVVAGLLVSRLDLWPDPTSVPSPKLFFLADKTFNTPMRVIQFLSLVAVFSAAWPYLTRAAERRLVRVPLRGLIELLSLLGRHSLYVFCVGSLLSLSAQVVRLVYRGSLASDTLVVSVGILVMAFTAWLAEARVRGRPAPASSLSPQRSSPQA
jgi:hypothetical protein